MVRAGHSLERLVQEFEPTAQSIRNRVGQAECDAGRGGNGLTTAEREEINQLRRENRQLRLERTCSQIGADRVRLWCRQRVADHPHDRSKLSNALGIATENGSEATR